MACMGIYQEILLLMLAEKDTTKDACKTFKMIHMRPGRVNETRIKLWGAALRWFEWQWSDKWFSTRLNSIVIGVGSQRSWKLRSWITFFHSFRYDYKNHEIYLAIWRLGNMIADEVVGPLRTHGEMLWCFKEKKSRTIPIYRCWVGLLIEGTTGEALQTHHGVEMDI